MRHVLVDHARARKAEKRGGDQQQVTLTEAIASAENKTVEVLALHEALENLSHLDPRRARVVELHFFGGLTFTEIAYVLDASERTVKRDWTMARRGSTARCLIDGQAGISPGLIPAAGVHCFACTVIVVGSDGAPLPQSFRATVY